MAGPYDKPGCSFFPVFLTDDAVQECCGHHDTVYRSGTGSAITKLTADANLGLAVSLHGMRTILLGLWTLLCGVWFTWLGFCMFLASACFGWWAWAYYRSHKPPQSDSQ